MNFTHLDATDKALTVTAAHDYLRAQAAWELFLQLSSDNINGKEDRHHLLAMYDAYSRFIHHLYEFYIACIKRNRQNTSNITFHERDLIFQAEMSKLMNNRAARIRRGDAPSWENPPEYYETPVPPTFAEHFRIMRNRTAHADYRRSLPASGISLADFFRQYHRYILLLFEEAHFLWNVKDVENFDWGEITEFNLAVRSGGNKT
jgi:hypothetical protein